MNQRRYEPRAGLLAVDPRAFLELFFMGSGPPAVDRTPDGIALVSITGPLEARSGGWDDSYESILERVKGELECDDVRAVMLRIDSPGGDVTGCFDTARALRSVADVIGKPVYAYLDRACSAAYALASAAHKVFAGDASSVGSIGVMSCRPDRTVRNAQEGIRIDVIASSARKLDGNPDVPMSDDERAETQASVDELAATFFQLVAEHRPPLSAARVEGYQARVFYGEAARRAGLVDCVTDFDAALETLRAVKGKGSAMSDYDKARDFLQRAAEGDDANAAAAKRALDALNAAGGGEADGEGDDKDKPADEPAPDAADEPADEPGAADEPADAPDAEVDDVKPKKAAAAARRSSGELSALAEVHKLRAEIEERDRRQERARLIASRPDFGPELRAALAKAPLATVRDMVKTLPRTRVGASKGQAPVRPGSTPITTVKGAKGGATGARGNNAAPGGEAPGADESLDAELDRRMGLTTLQLGMRREGATQSFGIVEVPARNGGNA